MSRHYLHQCWLIVSWRSILIKFQWNLNYYKTIFIQENKFEIVVCKMTAIFHWPQCVKLREYFYDCPSTSKLTHLPLVLHVCVIEQVMAYRLLGTKPLPEPMLACCKLDPEEGISVKFESKYKTFHSQKCISKCRLRYGGHFVLGEIS